MSKDEIIQTADALAGKKARLKKFSTEPTSDKEVKLPKDVKDALEEHFNVKLTMVRVHSGGNIRDVGKELKAKAFTIGQNVYVTKPGMAKDKQLLAHELTHVIQQSGGKMPKRAKPGTALISK